MNLQLIGKAFLNLFYPAHCFHCREVVECDENYLCMTCGELMELINPAERCPLCFSMDYSLKKGKCNHCERTPPILNGMAGTFDYTGPAASLIRRLKYFDQPYLAKGLGAYLATQFLQLDWPMPDLIVPVPISWSHWIDRGYNQSDLLAKSLGAILECPIGDVLGRKSGDYSQASLNRHQRLLLSKESFYLKKKQKISDKRLLLIDDVMTTGTTLRCCAETLFSGYPGQIYALTVCCGN